MPADNTPGRATVPAKCIVAASAFPMPVVCAGVCALPAVCPHGGPDYTEECHFSQHLAAQPTLCPDTYVRYFRSAAGHSAQDAGAIPRTVPPAPLAGFCTITVRQWQGTLPPAYGGSLPTCWFCSVWTSGPANSWHSPRTGYSHSGRCRCGNAFLAALPRP